MICSTKPLTIGSTGAADDTYQFPALVNAVLGTKFKIVTGYPGGNDVSLALERGEVQGRCGWSWSSIKTTRFNWVRDKRIVVLVQMSLSKHPDLPDVPLIMDLAKTNEQRQIFKMIFARQTMGRPYLAPPGVPADRLAALRKGFMDTMTDKEFLDEAEAEQIRDQSGEWRRARSAGQGRLPDAAGDREKGRRRGAVAASDSASQNNRVAERSAGNNSPSSDGGQATASAQWNTT